MLDMETLRSAFFELLPHATCYLNNPWLAVTIGTSDFLIGMAYWFIGWGLFSIGIALFEPEAWPIVYQTFRLWMVFAFGLFILLCGIGHWVDVFTLYRGFYWLTAMVRAATAFASVATALACWRVYHAIRTTLGHESVPLK